MTYLERLRVNKIAQMYYSDLQLTFDNIKPYLPLKAEKILDIGSGMAGIDLLLAKYYNYSIDIYLLDKEGVSDKIVAGFHQDQSKFAYYNSFSLAREFLESNGLPASRVNTINIGAEPFPTTERFELIVSLLSWGFHYPVDTYIEDVYRSLHENGVLILDIRKRTDGEKKLEEYFGKKPICIGQGKENLRFSITK